MTTSSPSGPPAGQPPVEGHVPADLLFLDMEVQATADLRKVGVRAYARTVHAVPCIAWAREDGPVRLWRPGGPLDWLTEHRGLLVAHNANFERTILREVFRFDSPVERWLDTAAVARAANLPGKLKELGEFLGIHKDENGHRIMLKLCRPRRPSKDNPALFWTPAHKPADFDKLYRYCKRDVHVMREAYLWLPPMSATELGRYHLTLKMNARGLRVDLPAVAAGIRAAKKESRQLSVEIERLTGLRASQTVALAKHLGVRSLAKNVLRDLLKDPSLPSRTRTVLELRQRYAKASVAKLEAFHRHAVDGMVYDSLIYGGAERTLRWTGAGVQLQNMPRGAGEAGIAVVKALHKGAPLPESVEDADGNVFRGANEIIKQSLRSFLEGPFLVGDYAQIEARLLSYIAGDALLLGAFVRGEDPYRLMASRIYQVPVEEVTKAQRFLGKQTVLGCGYGLSAGGFQSMLDITYDVQLPDDEADAIVGSYRSSAPAVCRLWRRLLNALAYARSRLGMRVEITPALLSMKFEDRETMTLRLPSGRDLWYFDVQQKEGTWLAYGRDRRTKQMGQVPLHGGALTGHVVQSTARDVVAEALERVENAGLRPLLSVHDEVICFGTADDLPRFLALMDVCPAWLPGFPLKSDCFVTERYRK